MSDRLSIGELDLLAYADDPLGLEPRRREAVESHLREHSEDASRVEIFRGQNLALRERFDHYARAPVPPRLYDALEARPASGRRLLRHAAAACVITAAAAAGWIAGEFHGGSALDGTYQAAPGVARPDAPAAQWTGEPQARGPVAVAGLLEYGAGLPELGQIGFSLVEAEPASGTTGEAARLTYADEDGRRFTLVLRSRWQDRNPGFQVEKRGEISVVSWEEGRLAAELTSRLGREQALEIAEAVRASLASVAPAGPLPADGLVAAGSAEAADGIDAGAPVLPQQVQ